jgi:peroxiredoxin|tara:strand:- start:216 stop:710 length:495 start_codon:yes stop_codon:yes gene_type:complete
MNLCIDTLEFKNLPEDVVSGFDIFDTRRVVVFGLPGAFTPTCSTKQVPGFDERYQEILELGIDEVYVVSVNDGFVMKAWMEQLGVENLKYLADGSGDFTRRMGMLVKKDNLGFGERSWRYAAVIEDGMVEYLLEEDGICNNCETDPYENSTPEEIIKYLKQYCD